MDEVGAKAHLQHAVIPQEILDKEKLLSETMRLKNAAAADQNFELAASYRDRECQLEDELQKLNKDWMQNDNGVRGNHRRGRSGYGCGSDVWDSCSEDFRIRGRHASPSFRHSKVVRYLSRQSHRQDIKMHPT